MYRQGFSLPRQDKRFISAHNVASYEMRPPARALQQCVCSPNVRSDNNYRNSCKRDRVQIRLFPRDTSRLASAELLMPLPWPQCPPRSMLGEIFCSGLSEYLETVFLSTKPQIKLEFTGHERLGIPIDHNFQVTISTKSSWLLRFSTTTVLAKSVRTL